MTAMTWSRMFLGGPVKLVLVLQHLLRGRLRALEAETVQF